MKSKLFDDLPKSVKLTSGKWVHIHPDSGQGHHLYDRMEEKELGRILFDPQDHWIYDGLLLSVDEQEELARAITGNQKDMEELLTSLKNEQSL